MKREICTRAVETLKQYRFAAAAVLVGMVLMLLPSETGEAESTDCVDMEEKFDRVAIQNEMETILRTVDGVGELQLMLTVDSGTRRELAQDITAESDSSNRTKKESETVIIGKNSGSREAIVTRSVYPCYVGALVVCEGGGSASVRLAVTEAVRVLTGLPSDKISVLRGTP